MLFSILKKISNLPIKYILRHETYNYLRVKAENNFEIIKNRRME